MAPHAAGYAPQSPHQLAQLPACLHNIIVSMRRLRVDSSFQSGEEFFNEALSLRFSYTYATPLSQGVGSKVQVLGFWEGGSSLLGLQMRSGRETLAGPLYTNRRYPAVILGAGTVSLSRLRPRHQLVVKSCRGPRLAAPALSEHPSASTRSHGARSTCCGSRKNDG